MQVYVFLILRYRAIICRSNRGKLYFLVPERRACSHTANTGVVVGSTGGSGQTGSRSKVSLHKFAIFLYLIRAKQGRLEDEFIDSLYFFI